MFSYVSDTVPGETEQGLTVTRIGHEIYFHASLGRFWSPRVRADKTEALNFAKALLRPRVGDHMAYFDPDGHRLFDLEFNALHVDIWWTTPEGDDIDVMLGYPAVLEFAHELIKAAKESDR